MSRFRAWWRRVWCAHFWVGLDAEPFMDILYHANYRPSCQDAVCSLCGALSLRGQIAQTAIQRARALRGDHAAERGSLTIVASDGRPRQGGQSDPE